MMESDGSIDLAELDRADGKDDIRQGRHRQQLGVWTMLLTINGSEMICGAA